MICEELGGSWYTDTPLGDIWEFSTLSTPEDPFTIDQIRKDDGKFDSPYLPRVYYSTALGRVVSVAELEAATGRSVTGHVD
jgi:hypothetical protein